MPCVGHSGEVTDPEADAGIVLRRLVNEMERGHNRQCIEPLAAWVSGQAVKERRVAIVRFELERPLVLAACTELRTERALPRKCGA
jgi:hypothetical protein